MGYQSGYMLENLRISDYELYLMHWTSVRARYLNQNNRENVMSADNQQERLDAQWIVGFVDGEGCFHVAISKLSGMTLGYQVLLEFRVVQHQRDEAVLLKLKNFFGFGSVVRNHGDRKEFRVRGLENLNKIVEFFRENPLQTIKQANFELFCEVIEMMKKKQHLTKEGLHKIAEIASQMNRQIVRNLESSETVCQTFKKNEDTVRTQQRCCEVSRNV